MEPAPRLVEDPAWSQAYVRLHRALYSGWIPPRILRTFAAVVAERVHALFRASFPHDPRPRQALEAAWRSTEGAGTDEELRVAAEAAETAARTCQGGWTRSVLVEVRSRSAGATSDADIRERLRAAEKAAHAAAAAAAASPFAAALIAARDARTAVEASTGKTHEEEQHQAAILARLLATNE